MASGSLLTKVAKSYQEAIKVLKTKSFVIHGPQATGCAPISTAFKPGPISSARAEAEDHAKSLAIGHARRRLLRGQRHQGLGRRVRRRLRRGNRRGHPLLAETEGIFAETAGGVTVAARRS